MLIPGKASISLSGLTLRSTAPWGGDARSALHWVTSFGYAAVQMDAAMPGLRPRELDQSARRDVLTMLRNRGACVSGLDLFVPTTHFVQAEFLDRAVSAVREALELAGQWSGASTGEERLSVSVMLPANVDPSVVATLGSYAERVGAVLADCAWPVRGSVDVTAPVGIDPALILMAAADPAQAVSKLAHAPATARLSDIGPEGRVEAGAGTGRLDVAAYRVALSVSGYAGPLVCDLRGLRDQAGAARRLRSLVEGTPA